MVTQQWIGRLPADARDGLLRIARLCGARLLVAPQKAQQRVTPLRAIVDAMEKAQRPRPLGHRRRATEHKAHTALAQLVCGLGELAQQPLARLGRQPIRDPHQLGALALCGGHHGGHRRGRPQKHGAPARLLGQSQKAQHAGHMHALAQRSTDHGFGHAAPFCPVGPRCVARKRGRLVDAGPEGAQAGWQACADNRQGVAGPHCSIAASTKGRQTWSVACGRAVAPDMAIPGIRRARASDCYVIIGAAEADVNRVLAYSAAVAVLAGHTFARQWLY